MTLVLYFIGVSTAQSSIRCVFLRWAEALGLQQAHLIGRVFNLNLSAEVVADLEHLAAETVR
jgi:hypothetical protein